MNRYLLMLVLAAVPALIDAQQQPGARQIEQERKSAERDAPRLVEVLELKPGMTVADVGTGGGR